MQKLYLTMLQQQQQHCHLRQHILLSLTFPKYFHHFLFDVHFSTFANRMELDSSIDETSKMKINFLLFSHRRLKCKILG